MIKLLFFCMIMQVFLGCKTLDPNEEIPAYLYINNPSVVNANSSLGSTSSKITDAYVFVGNDFWGVFELPALVPYFGTDSTKIVVQAAIKENGIGTTRKVYPMYKSIIKKYKFIPQNIDTLMLVTTYNSDVVALVNEDFEVGNVFTRVGGDTTMLLSTSGTDLFEGNRSAIIKMDTARPTAAFITMGNYVLATGSYTNVFLEINYKADVDFQLYFVATNGFNSQPYYKLNITPKENWNKIYVNLTTDMANTQPNSFNVLIKSKLATGALNSYVAFDNFKLLYN